jgi:hypothetical protein
VDSCKDSIICLDYFGEVDPHARQYSLVAQSLLKITTAHAKKRELHLRLKRKQASSELFGLLTPEHSNQVRPRIDGRRQPSSELLVSEQDTGQPSIPPQPPLDWTIYDADFFALPWPNENDQGLQDFLQPGTHNLDGASVADIPLFPMYDQQMGSGFFP